MTGVSRGDWLVERCGETAYRLALRITGIPEDAEAATGEALRAAADRSETFSDPSAQSSWVYRMAARTAYQRARKRWQGAEEIALADVLPALDDRGHFGAVDDWSPRVDDGGLQGELRRVLTDAIDALPIEYRTALVLHDVEGMSKPDIAETLGISPSGVNTRVHRSRLFVRQRLAHALASV